MSEGSLIETLIEKDSILKDTIATKLGAPPESSILVPRTKMINFLEKKVLSTNLIFLSAAAGFGKTTLLSQWFYFSKSRNIPLFSMAWLSLGEEDNDLFRFWQYILAALDTLMLEDLSSYLMPSMKNSVEASLSLIIKKLKNTLSQSPSDSLEKVLIIDDFHKISDQAIIRSIIFFINHLPPHIHLVIASRVDLPRPLSCLHIQNKMIKLGSADLGFNNEEIHDFIKLKTGTSIPTEEIDFLQRRTEGWPVGLQALVLSFGKQCKLDEQLTIHSFIRSYDGNNRILADFFESEVLNHLPEEMLIFLFETSIIDQLNVSICTAVTGLDNCRDYPEILEKLNLIIPLDQNHDCYRYYYLFVDRLQARLQQKLSTDQIANLHCRASEWYSRHEMPSKAIKHALAANNFNHAVNLIELNYLKLCEQGEFYPIYCWMNTLPESNFKSRPLLLIVRAWLEIIVTNPDIAGLHIEEALQLTTELDPNDTVSLNNIKPIALLLNCLLAGIQGDISKCVKLANEALLLLPEEDLFLRNIGQHAIGTALRLSKDFKKAVVALNETIIASRATGNYFFAIISMYLLANQYRYQGRLHKAEEVLKESEALYAEHKQGKEKVSTAGLILIGLGELQYQWNNLEEAEWLLTKGIKQLQRMGSVEFISSGYIALARVKQAQGDFAASLHILQKADAFVRKFRNTRMIALVEANLARFQMTVGETVIGIHWAESNDFRMDQEDIPLRETQQTTLARVLSIQGKYEQALLVLEQLHMECNQAGRKGSIIEIQILRALILYSQQSPKEAFIALEEAFMLAVPEHYIRAFVDEGQPMAILLHKYLRYKGIADFSEPSIDQYVNVLLAAIGTKSFEEPTRQEKSSEQDLLTNREIEIYRLLEMGYTNQQIAKKLFISENTVKTHRKSIYTKLEVNNRAKMIKKVKEMKLI